MEENTAPETMRVPQRDPNANLMGTRFSAAQLESTHLLQAPVALCVLEDLCERI